MEDILHKITANKRIEIEAQKKILSFQSLSELVEKQSYRTQSMRASLSKSPFGIIAEFKRKSPSKGWLHPEAKVDDIVPAYEKGGASACSVLTDNHFFGGSLEDLRKARSLVNLPLLRKDFIVDAYQLFQARLAGADAILLIASCLTPEACNSLAETAHSLGLEVLLEIHNESELTYLNAHIDMLGVNNRNLGTFHTDINNSFRLVEQMQEHTNRAGGTAPLLIAESGISSPETVLQLRKAGFQGFLIGETFMKTDHPGETLAGFIRKLN
ncbi:MAG: indole-3-glycerol phosphate synthase TrpC [Prevotellaceae bacterium]|jgi:indole-3-glycerol phosphate synthase|nr:indole-3-glycerol phosphate synthase TrpC [Prevotellaceae bacterium]